MNFEYSSFDSSQEQGQRWYAPEGGDRWIPSAVMRGKTKNFGHKPAQMLKCQPWTALRMNTGLHGEMPYKLWH